MRTFDVLQYLDDKEIEVFYSGKNISTSGGWIGVQCPFCHDHSSHGGINLVSKAYSCLRCGKKGMLEFIQAIENCSKSAAWHITRKYQNIDCYMEAPEVQRSVKVEMPDTISKDFAPVFKDYLLERNFDPDYIIDKYYLYSGGYVGFFKLRIVVPIILDREIVTFMGRDITNRADDPYRAYPLEKSKLSTKETLYNIDSVKDTVVIVEGILDAWRIGDGAVATLGTKFTSKQLRLLKGVKNAFILFDSKKKDPDAEKAALRFAYSLYGTVNHIEILDLDEGDPCDLTEGEVESLRKEIRL